MSEVDAVIVGSGPGGATTADVLTAAGWHVVMLEKGANRLLALDAPHQLLGHFSGDEIKFGRRHFLGPDPLLEPRTFRRGPTDGDRLFAGQVNNMPSTVGGAGFHADGKLPRFRAVDFRTASELGPIDGSTLADWPLDYDELEPYYAEAERLVGVAGDADGNPFAEWRSAPYPMPPGADMFGATLTVPAAEELGLHPYRAPTGANSQPYDGRPACNNCGFCAGYGCPIDAKGDPVAPLRRALRTGRLEIRPGCHVTDIPLDESGTRALGVRYLDHGGAEHEVTADHVVLAGGAFETPRLLLQAGVANSSGQVGRNLMFHFQTLVLGVFDHRLHSHRGRAVTHLHDDHLLVDRASRSHARDHDLPWFRGGIVEHGGAAGPIMEALHLPIGELHSQLMLESPTRDHLWVFTMQGEDLPQAANRVDLDPSVRDHHRLPAGRVTYSPHRHELVASEYTAATLEQVMRRAGAHTAFHVSIPELGDGGDPTRLAPDSKHVMGTARMGTDPTTSVLDPWQRAWDVQNVSCADSSVFPTSTGYGPTLTIVALALRAARSLAGLAPLTSTRPP